MMRVLVRHGHFAFFPDGASDVARFNAIQGVELERDGSFYTFPDLVGLADYSIAGNAYGSGVATKTFEGKPWEIMRENDLVYSIALEQLVPKSSIVTLASIKLVTFYFVSGTTLVQPGSILPESNDKIMSFDALFDDRANRLLIREFSNE